MRCSESENKLCVVDSVKNRHKVQDDLIEENSTRDAFAGACLSADKRSIIAIFKASVRQRVALLSMTAKESGRWLFWTQKD